MVESENKMTEKKYEKFFTLVKQIQETQKKQKQRGLNDYNMVNVVRRENSEVGMHSNVIYSLIDPNGLHYQEDLFLKLFIDKVLTDKDLKRENFGEILSVNAEESTNKGRRIDFTIKSTKYYIGIEMKIDACDLENQIFDYYEDLKAKVEKDNNQKVIIYYLTKDGKKASHLSSNSKKYKTVSFEKNILDWIDACQKEVSNITNLNEAFENYKNIVKKIVNKYKGKVMTLETELLKETEHFELAHEISESLKKARPKFIKSFAEKNMKEPSVEYVNSNNAIEIRHKEKQQLTIKIIFNHDFYRIQLFGKEYKENITRDENFDKILKKLEGIKGGFSSKDLKVYGDLDISYDNFKLQEFERILQELFNLLAEV